MKKATTVVPFEDLFEGVLRKTGDAFSCSDERGTYLEGLGLVQLKDVPEKKPKKTASTAKK
jgi:hypothetical protein